MTNVVKQLNQIQADAHAFFIAFHDYHWNVKGLQFYAIHEYTEKAYEEMAELYDDTAERAIQIGGKAILKADELVKLGAKAPVLQKDSYTPTEVLEEIRKAYKYLVEEFKKLEEVAEKAGDTTTSNMAQDHYGDYEKKIWMINQTLA
ncbi:Dps family protein [Campylobacter hyointestinalis]|uniref:DNA starvation/stationary phase protection protein n=2 Tax=Campylobacter hyointestinalis TaxID=198 RepID=A0AAV6EHM8_CAMHY|nr:DNA starvation/stationary phase protection protein [Campylobacter hyointestinalis]ANE33896.1 DNA-binding ferritin-like protein [Campylobacter hyointestinalis subsp. lawsonii CCUG 27631]KAB0614175.1 DNA starvation/stationary phase protection protein [Campylobacter hyointestinalis subsp. lawsonii]QKF69920.1 DNA-binding ferritin-like protein [Campylobacter hyointestinalis subsp. lawsonii]RAZ23341.1 DNA starvation/stationary phase protection protein [Campylobacter hyointestinalis subsp. lawsonii